MLAVAVTSFGGQLVLGRAYQIEVASKVAAVNYVQVGLAATSAACTNACWGRSMGRIVLEGEQGWMGAS